MSENLDSGVITQLLPKVPKLLPDGSGYDWRELDRWLHKIRLLIGTPINELVYNIPNEIAKINQGDFTEQLFNTNNQQGLSDLEYKLNSLAASFEFAPNYQQEIRDLLFDIKNAVTLSLFQKNYDQRLEDIERSITNNQTLYWMEA